MATVCGAIALPPQASAGLGARLLSLELRSPDECGNVAVDGWFDGEGGIVAGARLRDCHALRRASVWEVRLERGELVHDRADPPVVRPEPESIYDAESIAVAACRDGAAGSYVLRDDPFPPTGGGTFGFLDGATRVAPGDRRVIGGFNADCSRMVGSGTASRGGPDVPLVWDGDAPPVALSLPAGFIDGVAVAVARNAMARIVGTATEAASGTRRAIRGRDGVATALPLPEGQTSCEGTAISADGRFLAAVCSAGGFAVDGFVYLPDGAAMSLPRLPDSPHHRVQVSALSVGGEVPSLIAGAMLSDAFVGEPAPVDAILWVHRGGRWQAFRAFDVLLAQRVVQGWNLLRFPEPGASLWQADSVEFVANPIGTVLGGTMSRSLLGEGGVPVGWQQSGYVMTLPRSFRVRAPDVVLDGFVNSADVAAVRACLGSVAPLSESCGRADFDADDDVDRRDLAFVKRSRCRVPTVPQCD